MRHKPVAYFHDGETVCPDCIQPDAKSSPETFAVFPWDELADYAGATCFQCQRFLDTTGHWADSTDSMIHWSRCGECNSQKPFRKNTIEYREVRKASIFNGGAHCWDCRKPSMRF